MTVSKRVVKDVVLLEERIEEFLNWYEKYFIKKHTLIGEYATKKELRNLLEKVAVWYELRFPNYEIENYIKCSVSDVNYSSEMFSENQAIKKVQQFFKPEEQIIIDNFLGLINWDEFYSTKTFIHSLPFNEALFFSKPKYTNILYLGNFNKITLSSKGIILQIDFEEDKSNLIPLIKNKHITQVFKVLKKNFDDVEDVKDAITLYEKTFALKEKFLESIMIVIMLIGGEQIGPRRGLMFAEEFKLDLSLPMIYGVSKSDPFLKDFIDYYISLGGEKDIIFYENYYTKQKKSPQKLFKRIAGK